MRIRTWLSRASFVGAALLTVFALVAPPLSAQEDERPFSFQASGFATPIQASLNTAPQTFVEELVRVDMPHASGRFASGDDVSGRAASIFPGAATEEGPGLAWGVFWGRFCANPEDPESQGFPCHEFPGLPPANPIPPWPFSAQAEHPTRPEATPTVTGQRVGEAGDPLSFTVNDVRAFANPDGARSRAVISDLSFLPVAEQAASVPGVDSSASPALIHVGQLHATTDLRFEGKVLVAEAESRLSGISLAGGAVQIEKLIARSVSKTDGGKTLSNEPTMTLAGVTLGGQPAKVTDGGIVLGDGECPLVAPQAGPLCPIPGIASSGLSKLIESFGLTVRLIDTTDEQEEGTARGDAVGVMVGFKVDGSGFPGGPTVVGSLILGTASTSAFADASGLGDLDIAFDDDFAFDDTSFEDSGSGAFTEEFTEVGGETVDAGDLQAAPEVGPATSAQPRFAPLELLSGVAADRIKLLYGAWTLAVIGLALGSRTRLFGFATRP